MSVDIRRITIRISPALYRQLHKAADQEEVSLNVLAVKALETYVDKPVTERQHLPVMELSALLAPAAQAAEITEEDLLRHARQVRRRIWQERYERAVQAVGRQQESS
jgi:predicted transcriptional regulator